MFRFLFFIICVWSVGADSAVNTTLNTTTTSTNTLTDVHDKVHEKDEMLGLFIKLNDLIVGKVPFIVLIELINMAKEESIKIHEFLTQYQVGLRLPDEEKKYRGDIPMYYAGEDDLYLGRLCNATSKNLRKMQVKTTTTSTTPLPPKKDDTDYEDDEYDDSDDDSSKDSKSISVETDNAKFNRLKYKVDAAEKISEKLSVLMELCEVYTKSKG